MNYTNQSKEPVEFYEPKLHYGEIIEEKMKGHLNTHLAKDLNCHRNTISNIYSNRDINTERLVQISLLSTLKPSLYPRHNFFIHYKEYVTEEILKRNRYSLSVEKIEDLTAIDIYAITMGEFIQQKINKIAWLALKLSRTDSAASKACQNEYFNTYRLFNISIWVNFNLFVFYYERIEKQLNDFAT